MSDANPNVRTPVETVRLLIDSIQAKDYEKALSLYSDDAELSVLFAFPERVVLRGMNELVPVFRSGFPGRMYENISKKDLWIVEAEPGTVVAEWTYVSVVNGKEIENANVIIVGVKDGLVQWSRDYHNHVTRAVADGNLPDILSQISQIELP